MSYIILYNEKYGYLERFKNGYPVYTHDFHFACNYTWLDKARGYEVDICELEFKGSYEV